MPPHKKQHRLDPAQIKDLGDLIKRKRGRPPGSGTGTGARRGRPPGSGNKARAAKAVMSTATAENVSLNPKSNAPDTKPLLELPAHHARLTGLLRDLTLIEDYVSGAATTVPQIDQLCTGLQIYRERVLLPLAQLAVEQAALAFGIALGHPTDGGTGVDATVDEAEADVVDEVAGVASEITEFIAAPTPVPVLVPAPTRPEPEPPPMLAQAASPSATSLQSQAEALPPWAPIRTQAPANGGVNILPAPPRGGRLL